MSVKTHLRIHQYNTRIMENTFRANGVDAAKIEYAAIKAALGLYKGSLNIVKDDDTVDYAEWLEVYRKFLFDEAVLASDTDGRLEVLANKAFNSPDLLDYFRKYVNNGAPFDRVQIALQIKQMEEVLADFPVSVRNV